MESNSAARSDQPAAAMNAAARYGWSIVAARWLGAWIDFIVLVCFLLVPDLLLGNALYQRTISIWLGLLVLYFPVSEAAFGRSLGKLLMRLRVVNASGRRPSFRQAVVRTLWRLIEVNPLLAGGIPAGIAVLISSYRQRIGDRAARTFVLWDRDVPPVAAKVLPGSSLRRP